MAVVALLSSGDSHDRPSTLSGSGLCRSRLAQVVPQLFLCWLSRPRLHGLGQPAGDQRGPHRAGHGVWHARPPRHGNHQLRALRRVGPPRQHGQCQRDSAGRRAAHECGPRCATQRVQPRPRAGDALFSDLDRAQRDRHRAQLRASVGCGCEQAGSTRSHCGARASGREDSCRCRAVRGAV